MSQSSPEGKQAWKFGGVSNIIGFLTNGTSDVWWFVSTVDALQKRTWQVVSVPSGNLTWLRKITFFKGKIHYEWAIFHSTLNYQRVNHPIRGIEGANFGLTRRNAKAPGNTWGSGGCSTEDERHAGVEMCRGNGFKDGERKSTHKFAQDTFLWWLCMSISIITTEDIEFSDRKTRQDVTLKALGRLHVNHSKIAFGQVVSMWGCEDGQD